MCGRYTLTKPLKTIISHLEAKSFKGEYLERYNIAPTQSMPVVVAHDGNRELEIMRWGLIPSWSKDPKTQSLLINARAETIQEKPSFRSSFKKRRCLVPADGFYEWTKRDSGKVPYWIHMTDEGLFAFAGIWSEWGKGEDSLRSFSIITTEANSKLKSLHDRMPVIIGPENYAAWLDSAQKDPASLLNAYPSEQMAYHEVSLRVNSPKNDDPECLAPA
jgi:putative SOS response-associated peptidase YedK